MGHWQCVVFDVMSGVWRLLSALWFLAQCNLERRVGMSHRAAWSGYTHSIIFDN
jgi:hypothetical protein